MLAVEFSVQAQESLQSISEYISADSPAAADRTIDRILQLTETLAHFPYMAREGLIEGTREASVPNIPFVIVYMIDNNILVVLDVIHTARQWPPELKG